MEFDGNDRDDSDDGFGDRDDDEDDDFIPMEKPPVYDDYEDRDDFNDSSIDSDFSRDSKQMLEESFFKKRQFLPNTQILNSEMGMFDDDEESNNPLNGLNDSDPDFIGSMIDIDS